MPSALCLSMLPGYLCLGQKSSRLGQEQGWEKEMEVLFLFRRKDKSMLKREKEEYLKDQGIGERGRAEWMEMGSRRLQRE